MHGSSFQKFALRVTHWIGSPQSIAIHTVLFIASFALVWLGLVGFDRMLLVLTTIVSLEAIYLSLFIQMTVNYQGQAIREVEQDIDEIQEDVDEIQEDIDEIQEDVEEMSEETEGKTLAEIHAGLERLIKDIERLQHKA
jgi:low affinity Fe/Cu permease